MRLVLASASPRRAELLRAAGFAFDTLAVDLDERAVPGESPEAHVRRLATEKSARAMEQLSGFSRTAGADGWTAVLGADTVVVVDGTILGKPGDDDEAESMLRQLSGRAHEVLTGVSIRLSDWHECRVGSTTVELSRLTEAEVQWYVESGEGRDKAGAYAIQGLASRFIPRITGSYSNVVGLPIAVVYELLGEIASRRGSGYPTR
ncbi:MAG TPA: Maf family protein [Vicinamibacterales bacterium]|nr:Maf family protein [Vicinamibacterales bacterium]